MQKQFLFENNSFLYKGATLPNAFANGQIKVVPLCI
jgi:hypothetical protein